jgi:ABC-type sugar transport system ATPase subunit
VAIGRAIVREPTIFLFDEPLSNLDAELRVAMRAEITALHERLRTTMIYVTHDQVEAMTMADRIVVLRGGRVEQIGAPLELYNRPCNRFVAGFIGSPQMNFLGARVTAVDPAGVRIALDAGGEAGDAAIPADAGATARDARVTLGIRPEHIAVGPTSGAALRLAATIERSEQLGAASFLYCRLGNGDALTVHVPGQLAHRSGDAITVGIPAAAALLFDVGDGELALARRAPAAG